MPLSRRRLAHLSALAATGLAATTLAACGQDSANSSSTASAGRSAQSSDSAGLSIYATTGYLADAVTNIAPKAKVTTMVGPGGDPHTYQPSSKDIETIRSADLVLWNGLHLEAQMIKQLSSLGDKQLAVGDHIPTDLLLDWPETDAEGNALHDPHIWNSPKAWRLVVENIARKLAEVDAPNASTYHNNAAAYIKRMDEAVTQAHMLLDAPTLSSRVLVTGHDAFNYFGQEFSLDVHATDFVSTEAALSAQELSELADLIADKRVPVIFQDNQANPQAITSLKEAVQSRGWSVEVSTEELFADSLGESEPVNTYIGALLHNAKTVAEGLKAQA